MSATNRSKNFRRRLEEDDANADETTTTTTTNIAKPRRQNHHQAPKLLSFADDEDDTSAAASETLRERSASRSRLHKSSFPSSSSSSSHKITSSKDRVSSNLPSNVQSQPGEYTKERLRELQKNTRTLASSKPPPSEPKPFESEPLVVLKGLVKPVVGEERRGVEKAAVAEEADVLREKDDAEKRLRKMGIGKGRDSDGSLIPDQATINAIRAKRERLRKSRAAPDYISLDTAGSKRGGLSDDEADFQGRIAMLGEKTDGVKKGVFESVEGTVIERDIGRDGEFRGDDDDDDDEEEDKIWEEEQFRKGLGKRVDDGLNRASNGVPAALPAAQPVVHQPPFVYGGNVYQSTPIAPPVSSAGAVGVTRSVEIMSIPQQANVATRALQESVNRLKETHGRTVSSMTKTDENLSASLSNITALEKSLSAAGEKFIFMQKLRDFISVICDFLQDKAPFIEELEEQMQKLHEKRASAIIERRAADIADEMAEVEAAVDAAKSVLSRGGGAAVVAAAATAAQTATAAARERSNLPIQLDEFGRDVNLQKRMDSMRRSEARKRRKARSESKRISSIGDDGAYQRTEGESSTDESDGESTAYQSTRDELLQTAEQIFSDASDEYSKLSIVKERFDRWKKNYLSSYRDAYMSLSVPAIFSPYVRLELLKWDPLYEDADFNNMLWHSILFDYGLPEDGTEFKSDDADANLIPGIVEKVALPILHHEIAHCWDILSIRGTRNAVSATNLVVNYVPASSEALQELFAAIHTRLADAVADLSVPTWSTLEIKAVPDAARIAAYRFGMTVRLLKNICMWKDIFELSVLEQLALVDLLIGKVLPHLRNVTPNIHDAITRTERIIASLSGVWSGPNITGVHSQKLRPLVEYVATLGKSLEKRQTSGGVSDEEICGLARRLKKMLVELNEYDRARAILRTFQLKEAL